MLRLRRCLALLALPVIGLPACRTAPGTDPAAIAEMRAAARRAILEEQTLLTAELPAHTVAVAPLGASGDSAAVWLAYGLADLLMTDLSRSARLDVVDRLRLDVYLRELEFAESGRVDSATAPRMGRLLGARHLVIGSIGMLPDSTLSLRSRVANVPTAALQRVVTVNTAADAIFDAEKELAFELFRELGVDLTPAERAAVEQRPTRSLAALLAYSRGVRHQVLGRYDLAAREFERALELDPQFSQARTRRAEARSIDLGASSDRQWQRAVGATVSAVNPTFTPAVGGPADPVFLGNRTFTLIITVTNRP